MENILKRATLIVRDADASATWYETVFGMTRWYDKPFTLSGTFLAAGEKGDETRLVILKCDDPVIGMIGLLSWDDPPRFKSEEIPTTVKPGVPIFVIASEDARGVFERAKKMGTQIYAEPTEREVTGANNERKRMVSCSLFDPDGYFFEVNEATVISPAPAK